MKISEPWIEEANRQIALEPARWATDAASVLQKLLARESSSESSATLKKWMSNFAAGKFNDINYPAGTAGDDTPPLYEHLKRVRKLASAGVLKDADATACATCAAQALSFYIEQAYTTRNWWHAQIGLAVEVGRCMLLLAEANQGQQIDASLGYLQPLSNIDLGHVGANQMDFAYIQLLWSVAGWRAKGDSQYLAHVYAVSRAISHCCDFATLSGPTLGEGIRVDYSFSQHNPVMTDKRVCSQLYAGSYGSVFLDRFFKISALLAGVFSVSADSLETLEHYLTEGVGWFGYAGFYDFHCLGRSISRNSGGTYGWSNWCNALMPTAKKPALLQELKDLATGKVLTTPGFRSTRAFWTNDYLSHIDDDFAVFCKTVSTRTVGTETGNGENKKGYYMGCGTYFVHTHGKEYSGIQPAWHWQYLPGATVESVRAFEYPLLEWGSGSWGSHDFSGVVSDGQVGVATMILTRQNIQNTYKTVITVAGAVYCLGMAGDLSKTVGTVHTTVNQCWGARARVEWPGNTHSINGGLITKPDIFKVTHDGLVYEFFIPAHVSVELTRCEGTWKSINEQLSDDKVSGDIFTLWINHPKGLENKYGYIIRKEGTSVMEGIPAVAPDFHCDHDLQYVHLPNIGTAAGAVFTGSSVIDLGHIKITLLQPMAFIARYDTAELTLTLSDPTQKLDKAEVELQWGKSTFKQKLNLATDGDYRGRGSTVVFTDKGVVNPA